MTSRIVVLGAGYAGTVAIKQLEDDLVDTDVELVWVSDTDRHLVRHEIHRAISDPTVQEQLTLSIEKIKSSSTRFVCGEVVSLDIDARKIILADESVIEFDYVLVSLGSQTAFYDIDGLETHALTLGTFDDALAIHHAVIEAARDASEINPARIVVGGGGLTGIQCAGEIAALRETREIPIEVTIVEANENVASNHDSDMQAMLRRCLLARDIELATNSRIEAVDTATIHFDDRDSIDYDRLVWTGGIAGPDALADTDLDQKHGQLDTEATFETSDERIFAVGDCSLIDQEDTGMVPPTAEAAWEGGKIAGKNLARAVQDESPEPWSYTNNGTLISIGDATIAHEIKWMPMTTFGGPAARFFKKAITAKWVGLIASWRSAAQAWPVA